MSPAVVENGAYLAPKVKDCNIKMFFNISGITLVETLFSFAVSRLQHGDAGFIVRSI